MAIHAKYKPKHRTPFLEWLEENQISDWNFAKAMGCGPMAVSFWKWNQVLPDIPHAHKIAQLTGGKVTIVSWLDTPLGKERYAKVADWDEIGKGSWAEWSAKQRAKKKKKADQAVTVTEPIT